MRNRLGFGLTALCGAAAIVLAACGGGSSGGTDGGTAGCPPPAGSTAGLTQYDSLCGSSLDGTKWQAGLLNRGVVNGAMQLGGSASNMESRTVQFLSYQNLVTVNTALRVTTLTADITVPAASASRTGSAETRAIVRLSYQPPANRLNFPGGSLDQLAIEIGFSDIGGGLRAVRTVRHCDTADCLTRSRTGIALADPAGFTLRAGDGSQADAAAAYDTTYTVTASLNEATGVLTWSFAGGTFGAGVSGTADPAAYLAGNANWTGIPLAGAGFVSAVLGTRAFDESVAGGSAGSGTARFQNVKVGLNNAAATLYDDFSGAGGNSGPTELRGLKWVAPGGAPGSTSTALPGSGLAAHIQTTSNSTAGIATFDALTFNNPAAVNTMQADVNISTCTNTFAFAGKSNRVQLQGNFYNDGSAGTTPPNTNQPNSGVGDVRAFLFLDCVTNAASFQIVRGTAAVNSFSAPLNSTNNSIPVGSAATGNTHTLRMAWNPTTHFFTFQVDGGAPVVVDPTTVNFFMATAAPFVKAANSPQKQIAWGAFVPPSGSATGAAANLDLTINNVYTAP